MPELSTKEKLKRSAVKVTVESGMDLVTTQSIAKMAGCSEAMIYRFFKGKNELLTEVFLEIDSILSNFLLQNKNISVANLDEGLKESWHNIWRWLLDHPDETLFLIRFRYSSLYTDETRNKRLGHDGSFDAFNQIIDARFGSPTFSYSGFIFNYLFEITLSFAERVALGRFVDNENVEQYIWNFILYNLHYKDYLLDSLKD